MNHKIYKMTLYLYYYFLLEILELAFSFESEQPGIKGIDRTAETVIMNIISEGRCDRCN